MVETSGRVSPITQAYMYGMYNHFLNLSQFWLHTDILNLSEGKKPVLVSGECLRLKLALSAWTVAKFYFPLHRRNLARTVTSVGEITKTLTSQPLGEQCSQSGDLGRQENGQSAAIVLIWGTLNKPGPAARLQKNQMEKHNSEERNLFNTGSTGKVGPSVFSFTGKGQMALYFIL